ncbi:MAG TPA: hypothetical protein H9955_04315, partial [Candidatus Mediterraneibacter cottocaccae]|nr:hypothetical protein [Candidatus Mediterraneibacter cottocaccae]
GKHDKIFIVIFLFFVFPPHILPFHNTMFFPKTPPRQVPVQTLDFRQICLPNFDLFSDHSCSDILFQISQNV